MGCGTSMMKKKNHELMHLISVDAKGTLINWTIPDGKNPELHFMECRDDAHCASGGIRAVNCCPPRMVVTLDPAGGLTKWVFDEPGMLKPKACIFDRKISHFTVATSHFIPETKAAMTFTGSKNGQIVQWKFPEKSIFKNWNYVSPCEITALLYIPETNHLLVANAYGVLQEFTVSLDAYSEPEVFHDWGKIHHSSINSLCPSSLDAGNIFTSSIKELKLRNLKTRETLKDFSSLIGKFEITSMVLTADDSTVFFSDYRFIRKLNLKTGKYGEVYDDHKYKINQLATCDPWAFRNYWSEELEGAMMVDVGGKKYMKQVTEEEEQSHLRKQFEKVSMRTSSQGSEPMSPKNMNMST
jgi:hypothetical protein